MYSGCSTLYSSLHSPSRWWHKQELFVRDSFSWTVAKCTTQEVIADREIGQCRSVFHALSCSPYVSGEVHGAEFESGIPWHLSNTKVEVLTILSQVPDPVDWSSTDPPAVLQGYYDLAHLARLILATPRRVLCQKGHTYWDISLECVNPRYSDRAVPATERRLDSESCRA